MATPKSESELVELVKTRARGYLRLANVTSVGVGYRKVGGKVTDELSVQFTVDRKLAPEAVGAEGLTLLPEAIAAEDGTWVPVDVLERSFRPSYQIVEPRYAAAEDESGRALRRQRLDPVRPGISIANVRGRAGTLGGIVFDATNGTPYLLSNWHVLHGPGGGIGDVIAQPGPYDDTNLIANGVGRLVRSHLGMSGDCAVCSIVGRAVDHRILELDVAPRRIANVSIGDRLVKSGRTTAVTRGVVSRVGVFVTVEYGGEVGEREIGGFEIQPNPAALPSDGEISSGGDSGSLWMIDTDGADADVVAGLHFAGETDPAPSEEHAIACNIKNVLEKLRVSFTRPEPAGETAARPHAGSRAGTGRTAAKAPARARRAKQDRPSRSGRTQR